jgi:hypothetical protein
VGISINSALLWQAVLVNNYQYLLINAALVKVNSAKRARSPDMGYGKYQPRSRAWPACSALPEAINASFERLLNLS